jgi:thymidine kinase
MLRLEVITGPMFSGKSEELLRRLKRAAYADQKTLLIKPEIDGRKTRDIFQLAENDQKLAGYKNLTKQAVGSADDLKDAGPLIDCNILTVDEVHFFETWFEKVLCSVLEVVGILI